MVVIDVQLSVNFLSMQSTNSCGTGCYRYSTKLVVSKWRKSYRSCVLNLVRKVRKISSLVNRFNPKMLTVCALKAKFCENKLNIVVTCGFVLVSQFAAEIPGPSTCFLVNVYSTSLRTNLRICIGLLVQLSRPVGSFLTI